MTNPTRQEMLDSITHKIARTAHTEYSNIRTNYYLPVMIGDVLDYLNVTDTHVTLLSTWKLKREPLSAQDDECVTYIFNKLPHD